MATLLELYQIEADSKKDPMQDGSPQGEVDPIILGAVELRAKIRIALTIHARTLLAGGTINSGQYPLTGEDSNNAIAWAQRVIISPDNPTDAAMRLALAGGEAFTPAQIRGVSDAAIKSAIEPIIPALAKGMHPGR